MIIDSSGRAIMAPKKELGFLPFIVSGIAGAVSSLFQGQTVPITPPPPQIPWWQTRNGMIVIGVGAVAALAIGIYAFSGSSTHSRRRRRRRR